MDKELIKNVFAKAKEETGLKTITQLATHISNALEQHHDLQVNERTLRNYYNDIKNNKSELSMSPVIQEALCKYLGYKNRKDYILKTEKKSLKSRLLANKEKVAIGALIVVASYFGMDAFDKNCMIWTNDHYKVEKCETSNTIPIEETLLNNFKKVTPDCDYPFFKKNGQANLWYGKSTDGNYEYFTTIGVHPYTGKTLKAITPYIIKTHICNNDN